MYVLFQSFMTGNLYHHLNNLALLAVPFAKRPNLVSMQSCAVVSSYRKIIDSQWPTTLPVQVWLSASIKILVLHPNFLQIEFCNLMACKQNIATLLCIID